LKPLVNLGFGLEPLDVTNFGSGIVGLDLPIALRNALKFEDNPRGFAHEAEYGPFGGDGNDPLPGVASLFCDADPRQPHELGERFGRRIGQADADAVLADDRRRHHCRLLVPMGALPRLPHH